MSTESSIPSLPLKCRKEMGEHAPLKHKDAKLRRTHSCPSLPSLSQEKDVRGRDTAPKLMVDKAVNTDASITGMPVEEEKGTPVEKEKGTPAEKEQSTPVTKDKSKTVEKDISAPVEEEIKPSYTLPLKLRKYLVPRTASIYEKYGWKPRTRESLQPVNSATSSGSMQQNGLPNKENIEETVSEHAGTQGTSKIDLSKASDKSETRTPVIQAGPAVIVPSVVFLLREAQNGTPRLRLGEMSQPSRSQLSDGKRATKSSNSSNSDSLLDAPGPGKQSGLQASGSVTVKRPSQDKDSTKTQPARKRRKVEPVIQQEPLRRSTRNRKPKKRDC